LKRSSADGFLSAAETVAAAVSRRARRSGFIAGGRTMT
jgi:hypothetical protein